MLADTNLLIRYLAGDQRVQRLILDNEVHLSFISELELYAKPSLTMAEEAAIVNLINGSTVLFYEERMKEEVIRLRRSVRMKLPDAIIAATAIIHNYPLLTSDKDFKPAAGLNIILIS